jgi:hypothetical protein
VSDGHTDGSQPAGNTVDLATEYTKNIRVVQLVTYWEHLDTDPEPPGCALLSY